MLYYLCTLMCAFYSVPFWIDLKSPSTPTLDQISKEIVNKVASLTAECRGIEQF